MVVVGRLDFLGILDLPGQFSGRVDQGGETLGADIHLLAQVLQCYQGNLFFGISTIQTGIHNIYLLNQIWLL
jgi:hypothetical protein